MGRVRTTIAGLMALILLAAMALAALRHSSPFLASALYSLDVGVVCVAALGALFDRGTRRRMWTGFGIFAGAYLAVAFATHPLAAPSLLTTWGLSYVDAKRGSVVASTDWLITWSYVQAPPAPSINLGSLPFLQVGHCLVAPLAGLLGAGVALLMGREAAGR